MAGRRQVNTKKRIKNFLLWGAITMLCGGLSFLSFNYFEGVLTRRDKEMEYRTEGIDLYVNVINNYQYYVSNIMGVAYAINDTVSNDPEKSALMEDEIFKLASMVYSYNTVQASNKLDAIIMLEFVDQERLATPIKMYHEQKHNLDIAIVQYNAYATEHELKTVTNYDSIRLLINDKATKEKIRQGNK